MVLISSAAIEIKGRGRSSALPGVTLSTLQKRAWKDQRVCALWLLCAGIVDLSAGACVAQTQRGPSRAVCLRREVKDSAAELPQGQPLLVRDDAQRGAEQGTLARTACMLCLFGGKRELCSLTIQFNATPVASTKCTLLHRGGVAPQAPVLGKGQSLSCQTLKAGQGSTLHQTDASGLAANQQCTIMPVSVGWC